MKPVVRAMAAPLRKTSLQSGTRIAIGFLLLTVGFILGWVVHSDMLSSIYCFPAV